MKLIAVVLVVFSLFPSEDAFKIKPRIVNGFSAMDGQFPYYAYLQVQTVNQRFVCGGTLLNDEFVLTAAHCTDKVNITAVNVHLGSADVYRSPHVVRVEKSNIFKYPKFVPSRPTYFDISTCFKTDSYIEYSFCSLTITHLVFPHSYSIGLIRLPSKVQFTPQIQPVRLPTTCEIVDNIDVVIMGNGRIKDVGPSSPQLQYATSKTIPLATCCKNFRSLLFRTSVICALDQENTHRKMSATCCGDSGSPLVKIDGTLIGVTSFSANGKI